MDAGAIQDLIDGLNISTQLENSQIPEKITFVTNILNELKSDVRAGRVKIVNRKHEKGDLINRGEENRKFAEKELALYEAELEKRERQIQRVQRYIKLLSIVLEELKKRRSVNFDYERESWEQVLRTILSCYEQNKNYFFESLQESDPVYQRRDDVAQIQGYESPSP